MTDKLAVGLWAYGRCAERYVSEGYKESLPFEERIRLLSQLDGVRGVELCYPYDIDRENARSVAESLRRNGLQIASIITELACEAQWQRGSLSSSDPEARERSIALVKGSMDVAAEIGVKGVNLWLGQDGFDYVFEADYAADWDRLVQALRLCAEYRPDIRLALEYKVSEPRMKCYVGNAGTALSLCLMTGCPNVGVTLDIGHSFNAGENPATVAALLASQNRLFHVHINDNYGIADDDMPAGTVHWPQWFEFVHWLKRTNYDGWIAVDIYPYRDDPQDACTASVQFYKLAERVAEGMRIGCGSSKSGTLSRLFSLLGQGGGEQS